MESPLYYYALCSVVLFAKLFLLSSYQGFYRLTTRTFTNPEDARAFGDGTAVAQELPEVQRAANAWRNDVENIPMFLGLGIAYVMVDASTVAAPYLFLGFTVSRIAHTLAYLAGVQPWRTLAYAVGISCMIGMSVEVVRALGA